MNGMTKNKTTIDDYRITLLSTNNIDLYALRDNDRKEDYYFNERIFTKIEQDGFIDDMFKLCGALFGRGDCDVFDAKQCKVLKTWLEERIKITADQETKKVYEKMLEFANFALKHNTGIEFSFK
ncbi:MAG: hypothetical protein WC196_03175 [Bacilli bacterium]|nr:hypothetical protein [Bacilli bacterium]MDD3422201.1 hypothetical protein [Bacilli bacterium]MDD4065700.1 hypothetical protein [Bacilli bacterium]